MYVIDLIFAGACINLARKKPKAPSNLPRGGRLLDGCFLIFIKITRELFFSPPLEGLGEAVFLLFLQPRNSKISVFWFVLTVE